MIGTHRGGVKEQQCMHWVPRLAALWLAAFCLAVVLWHARPLAAQSPPTDESALPAARQEGTPAGALLHAPDPVEEAAVPGALYVAYPAGGELLRDEAVALARSSSGLGLQRVQFYLETSDTACPSGGCLVELGSDGDGADEWSVPFSVETLDPQGRYRLLALGVDAGGQVITARGDWFSVWPEQSPAPWIQAPVSSPLRGQSLLAALPGGNAVWPSHLAFYLSSCPRNRDLSAQYVDRRRTLLRRLVCANSRLGRSAQSLALFTLRHAHSPRWRLSRHSHCPFPGSFTDAAPAGILVSIRNDDLPRCGSSSRPRGGRSRYAIRLASVTAGAEIQTGRLYARVFPTHPPRCRSARRAGWRAAAHLLARQRSGWQ